MSAQDQPIEIISIGTCPPPSGAALTSREVERGLLDWGFGKILKLSMDAQASGYQYAAQFLSEHLSKLGKTVDILRLDESAPSSDQAKFLNLDSTSEKTCNTLIQLGKADAFEMHGKSIAGRDPYKKIVPIFESMPILQNQE